MEVYGDDIWGDHLIKKFYKAGVEVPCPVTIKKTATQQFWIAIDPRGQTSMVGIPGARRALTAAIVRDKFKSTIIKAKHFHTEVAVIPLKAALAGARIAKKASGTVFLDIDGDPFYLIKQEKIGTEKQLLTKQKISRKVVRSILELGPKIVVITKASKGCIIGTKDIVHEVPGITVKTVDSVGAGDAFMGALSYGILKKWDLVRVARFANACGAVKCIHSGSRSQGTEKEILHMLNN